MWQLWTVFRHGVGFSMEIQRRTEVSELTKLAKKTAIASSAVEQYHDNDGARSTQGNAQKTIQDVLKLGGRQHLTQEDREVLTGILKKVEKKQPLSQDEVGQIQAIVTKLSEGLTGKVSDMGSKNQARAIRDWAALEKPKPQQTEAVMQLFREAAKQTNGLRDLLSEAGKRGVSYSDLCDKLGSQRLEFIELTGPGLNLKTRAEAIGQLLDDEERDEDTQVDRKAIGSLVASAPSPAEQIALIKKLDKGGLSPDVLCSNMPGVDRITVAESLEPGLLDAIVGGCNRDEVKDLLADLKGEGKLDLKLMSQLLLLRDTQATPADDAAESLPGARREPAVAGRGGAGQGQDRGGQRPAQASADERTGRHAVMFVGTAEDTDGAKVALLLNPWGKRQTMPLDEFKSLIKGIHYTDPPLVPPPGARDLDTYNALSPERYRTGELAFEKSQELSGIDGDLKDRLRPLVQQGGLPASFTDQLVLMHQAGGLDSNCVARLEKIALESSPPPVSQRLSDHLVMARNLRYSPAFTSQDQLLRDRVLDLVRDKGITYDLATVMFIDNLAATGKLDGTLLTQLEQETEVGPIKTELEAQAREALKTLPVLNDKGGTIQQQASDLIVKHRFAAHYASGLLGALNSTGLLTSEGLARVDDILVRHKGKKELNQMIGNQINNTRDLNKKEAFTQLDATIKNRLLDLLARHDISLVQTTFDQIVSLAGQNKLDGTLLDELEPLTTPVALAEALRLAAEG